MLLVPFATPVPTLLNSGFRSLVPSSIPEILSPEKQGPRLDKKKKVCRQFPEKPQQPVEYEKISAILLPRARRGSVSKCSADGIAALNEE